jgi:transposase
VAESSLEGDGCREGGAAAAGFRGRDGDEYFPFCPECLVTYRKASVLLCAPQPREEHHLACQHERGGYGVSSCSGGCHRPRSVLKAYLEEVLAPSLRSGQIVVMDNLSAHKGDRVRELIEERGCELVYLPSYSPDLNPIEEAFSKLKVILRKAEARSREALIEAMGRALEAITPQDAEGFFRHCGYRSPGQLL